MLESAKYSIPSVFQDLKDDQVRGDIFSTLVHLDDVINDVFDHISKRLTEEKDRVGSVNEVCAIILCFCFCVLIHRLFHSESVPAGQKLNPSEAKQTERSQCYPLQNIQLPKV